MAVKKGLGRGLDALLTGRAVPQAAPAAEGLREIPLDQLRPSPFQPRRDMAPEALEELAQSIRAQGVMQPIVVREVGEGFEIIAGERRWRASRLAGLKRIPAVVRTVDDTTAMALALIENIQRQDLSPLEEALALQRLIKECKLTQQACAEAVGRSRPSVSNLLRLLDLPQDVQELLRQGKIEMGHARALLTLESAVQSRLAQKIAALGLSVRQAEMMVQQAQGGKTGAVPAGSRPSPNPRVHGLESALAKHWGMSVSIRPGAAGKGQLVLRYDSLDQLDNLLTRLPLNYVD